MSLSPSSFQACSFAVLSLLSTPAEPVLVEPLLVRALNPADGLAIIQEPDGDLLTVRVGDSVSGPFKVVKVLEDRLVVEGVVEPGNKAKLWIFQAGPGEKSSRVVVLERKKPSERRASPRKDPQ